MFETGDCYLDDFLDRKPYKSTEKSLESMRIQNNSAENTDKFKAN